MEKEESMTTSQRRIKDWMRMFGQDTPNHPTLPDDKILELRCRLLMEEALEFCDAAGFKVTVTPAWGDIKVLVDISKSRGVQPDLDEMVDALADIKYVQEGAACALGVDMEPVDDEVHSSNMSKMWTKDELDQMPPDTVVLAVGVNQFVVRRNDGKVVKSPSFRPPDIQRVLESQSV